MLFSGIAIELAAIGWWSSSTARLFRPHGGEVFSVFAGGTQDGSNPEQ